MLPQSSERGNAEKLAEAVPSASARALQRFLTDSPSDESFVCERLQEFPAARFAHPETVWAVDDSGFPKQGRKSAGVPRQYIGALGKKASCQGGVFLAFVSPRGRALVEKGLFLTSRVG